MPWQMAPPLIVICGAFTVSGLLLHGIDYLWIGQHRRVRIGAFEHNLDERDTRIKFNLKKYQESQAGEDAKQH